MRKIKFLVIPCVLYYPKVILDDLMLIGTNHHIDLQPQTQLGIKAVSSRWKTRGLALCHSLLFIRAWGRRLKFSAVGGFVRKVNENSNNLYDSKVLNVWACAPWEHGLLLSFVTAPQQEASRRSPSGELSSKTSSIVYWAFRFFIWLAPLFSNSTWKNHTLVMQSNSLIHT